MPLIVYDFLIGLFLANAIPHLICGLMEIKFLSLFGFGHKANIIYSVWNVCLALAIALYAHGASAVLGNGILWGVFAIYLSFVLIGRMLYRRWNPKA